MELDGIMSDLSAIPNREIYSPDRSFAIGTYMYIYIHLRYVVNIDQGFFPPREETRVNRAFHATRDTQVMENILPES